MFASEDVDRVETGVYITLTAAIGIRTMEKSCLAPYSGALSSYLYQLPVCPYVYPSSSTTKKLNIVFLLLPKLNERRTHSGAQ